MRIGIIGPSDNEINPFLERIQINNKETFAMLKRLSGRG